MQCKTLCGETDCNYCNERSLAFFKRICLEWSEDNLVQPNMVRRTSQKKYWLNCGGCGRKYEQRAVSMCNRGCTLCKNKTELKLYRFLTSKYDNVVSQVRFVWSRKFTFDFCINDSIIVELDGPHHFAPVKNWTSGWNVMNNDLVKETLAIDNNFYVIRLLQSDVHKDKDWRTYLQQTISEITDDKIVKPCVRTPNRREYNGHYRRHRLSTFF